MELFIGGGVKQKLTPEEVIDALESQHQIPRRHVNQIDIGERSSLVSVNRSAVDGPLEGGTTVNVRGKDLKLETARSKPTRAKSKPARSKSASPAGKKKAKGSKRPSAKKKAKKRAPKKN